MSCARIWIVAIALVLAGGMIGCSSNDGAGARKYLATQNPGDVWEWTLTSDTFDARNETTSYIYRGRLEKMDNKFLKLTIESTTDPDPFLIGAVMYAIEVPRTLLMVKPAHATDVIVGAALGSCPDSSGTYNVVQLPWAGWDVSSDQSYSVINVTVAGSSLDVATDKYLITGANAGHEEQTGFSCVDGRVTHAPDPVVATVAPSGAFVVDEGAGNGGSFGTVQPAANVDMNDVLASGREFRGMVFDNINTVDEATTVGWARPDGGGGMLGGGYTDFEGNVENVADTVSITFTGQAMPGIVNGNHTDSTSHTTGNSVYIINRISDRYVIYGMVYTPGSGAPDIFIFVEIPN